MEKIIVLVDTQEQFELAQKVLGGHEDFTIIRDQVAVLRPKNGDSYGYWLDRQVYWERKRTSSHE